MKTSIDGKILVLIYLSSTTNGSYWYNFQNNLQEQLLGFFNVANLFSTKKGNHKITHTFESQAFNLALHSLNKETAVKWLISIIIHS